MIAIKEMKMPNSCSECNLTTRKTQNYVCSINLKDIDCTETKRPNDCPLVEIVTCKDCKYYREDDDTGHCTNHTCGDIVFWCRDDYYCADAEEKGESK